MEGRDSFSNSEITCVNYLGQTEACSHCEIRNYNAGIVIGSLI